MRERVVVLVKPRDVPVMVTVKVPVVAVPVADRVKRLLAVAGFVPNVALTPFGTPDAVRLTLPLKPLRGLIAMVVEPEAPWRIVTLAGEAERRKPGCVVDVGQLLTKLAAFTVPMPVAKSHPVVVPYAGAKDVLEVESTPTEPSERKQLGPVQSTSMSPMVTSKKMQLAATAFPLFELQELLPLDPYSAAASW